MSARVRWLGHSSATVDVTTAAGEVRVVTDPVLRSGLAHLRRRPPAPAATDAAGAHLALVSHLHHDHCDLPSLRSSRPDLVVAPPRSALWLAGRLRGGSRVVEVAVGATRALSLNAAAGPVQVRVSALPAHHAGHRTAGWAEGAPADALAVQHLVRVPGAFPARAAAAGGPDLLLWAVGDTGEFDRWAAVLDVAGRAPDVALVPVGGWGHTLGPHHLDPRQAAALVARVRPAVSVPVHWGTLHPVALSRTMGDRFVEPGRRFVAEARRLGVAGAVQLPVGGTLELDDAGEPVAAPGR
ncbi:MBL fold metallo-hydrolase [Kineococcus sp. T13]|uniref:MBL fold metallo-hydrolase n=1 Tax=Kineococcus vitellinus TaxID=2696565 RepID=UPI001412EF93|nr:MBL fold metallo-hydrolase [Kineococcus vitellinus]